MKLHLSSFSKTWIFDIDGTIFIHNKYLTGDDEIVPGFLNLFKQTGKDDYILLLTSREKKYAKKTIEALKKHNIRYDQIIFNLPKGERIIVNDSKPKGLKTAIAVCTERDVVHNIKIEIDKSL